MHIMVAGGTGFIGQQLVPFLLKKNHRITVLGRDKIKNQKIFSHTHIETLTWNNLISSQSKPDMIINLSGENIGDSYWTTKTKQRILQSRIDCTQKIIDYCLQLPAPAPRIINASAVGIYGSFNSHQNPQPVFDESSNIPWGQYSDFLSETGQRWEETLDKSPFKNSLKLRFGVVLSSKGGMLKKLLPSVKCFLAAIIGDGEQFISWIHIDDLIAAIDYAIEHPSLIGVYNLTSPYPVSQKILIKALCKSAHRPCLFRIPASMIKVIFGEMGECLLLNGNKVIPTKLLEHGFQFKFATIQAATDNILKEGR